jgi:hypothetical protein
LAQEKRAGFGAAVALYPGCGRRFGAWRADWAASIRGVVAFFVQHLE